MNLGQYQELTVLYEKDFGVFLGNENEKKGILLPRKQVPENTGVGDKLKVFLYKDSEDRLIATTKTPLITLGELAVLRVTQKTNIGAFLDWGLDRDLFLPFRETKGAINVDDRVLVKLYIDRSERLCATMNIYKDLAVASCYKENDIVTGTVYGINPQIGVFVAVENRFYGMIPKQNVNRAYKMGETVTARVVRVREDGKLDLGTERPAYLQMEEDAKIVRKVILNFDGELPFGEKASPEIIKREFGLSKAAFKRAISYLIKNGEVISEDEKITLIKK